MAADFDSYNNSNADVGSPSTAIDLCLENSDHTALEVTGDPEEMKLDGTKSKPMKHTRTLGGYITIPKLMHKQASKSAS